MHSNCILLVKLIAEDVAELMDMFGEPTSSFDALHRTLFRSFCSSKGTANIAHPSGRL